MSHPQTVGFELEVRYDRWERGTELPRTQEFVFHTLEKMETRYRTERKRRALKDRATSGRYRLFLTEHGKQACAADPDCAARHSDVGTWHSMDR
jgi:hypothetical protein